MAPELFADEEEEDLNNDMENIPFRPIVTKETDTYAYGLVALQVCCSRYYFLQEEKAICDLQALILYFVVSPYMLPQILTGKDPIRRSMARKTQAWPKRNWYDPDSITSDRLWRLFEGCCEFDPKKRPTMEEVFERVQSMGQH
jgi:Protein kinase domain.